jgi:hypothetical protein
MTYRIRKSCPWCERENDVTKAAEHKVPAYCTNCHHRADVPRVLCDCSQCKGQRATAPHAAQQGDLFDRETQ